MKIIFTLLELIWACLISLIIMITVLRYFLIEHYIQISLIVFILQIISGYITQVLINKVRKK